MRRERHVKDRVDRHDTHIGERRVKDIRDRSDKDERGKA
jgi:hypothetical protein